MFVSDFNIPLSELNTAKLPVSNARAETIFFKQYSRFFHTMFELARSDSVLVY